MTRVGLNQTTGARPWRIATAWVLVASLFVSILATHFCSSDGLAAPGRAVSAEMFRGGTGAPIEHGLAVHVSCACHVGAMVESSAIVPMNIVKADAFTTPVEVSVRPGPSDLPFEPPRV